MVFLLDLLSIKFWSAQSDWNLDVSIQSHVINGWGQEMLSQRKCLKKGVTNSGRYISYHKDVYNISSYI